MNHETHFYLRKGIVTPALIAALLELRNSYDKELASTDNEDQKIQIFEKRNAVAVLLAALSNEMPQFLDIGSD